MPLTGLLDTVLDRAIAPGYSRLGFAVRRRLPGWEARLPAMTGRRVVITGATSGIGEAAAAGFAGLGADLVLLVRNEERGAASRDRILAAARDRGHTPGVQIVRCDIGDLTSVRAAAEEILSLGAVNVLVHDAGVMPSERDETDDGIELAFATNVVGPFLLTALLEERLKDSAPSRVITVSSGGMYAQKLPIDDLQSEEGSFGGTAVYARNKRAQVILGELWADRLRGTGVDVHTMHPGWADTPGVQDSMPGFHKVTGAILRDADGGADTIVWLGASDAPAGDTGGFWHDRRRRPTHYVGATKETADARARLWAETARLAGLDDVGDPVPGATPVGAA